jgi:hypothetical protein
MISHPIRSNNAPAEYLADSDQLFGMDVYWDRTGS